MATKLVFIFCFIMLCSTVQAQSDTPKEIDYTDGQPIVNTPDDLLNDDETLKMYLKIPYEKRQYLFPMIHESTYTSHKIKSHPDILVWKNKKPTVIAPHLKEFASKYLDKLRPSLYPVLDPDFWALPDEDKQQIITRIDMDPFVLPEEKDVSYTYPRLEKMFNLPPLNAKSDLTFSDMANLMMVLSNLNDFLDAQENARDLKSQLTDLYVASSDVATVYPFKTYVHFMKQLGLEQAFDSYVKQSGFKDTQEFTDKSERLLKAYRAQRVPLALAIQVNHLKHSITPYQFNLNQAPTSEQLYPAMIDASIGDINFAIHNDEALKNLFPEKKLFGRGLFIYVD